MATVPRGNATNVGASKLPYVSSGASANDFGAQKGQALQQVGQDLSQIGQQAYDIHRQNVQRETKNLYIEDKKYKSLLLEGDGTAENPGYLNLRGEDALKAAPLLEKALADNRSKLLKNVSSQAVKNAFTDAVNEADIPDLDRVRSHMATERERANDATDIALIKQAQDDAARNSSDPRKVDQSLLMIGEVLAQVADRKGQSKETMQQNILSAYSETVRKVIEVAAQKDTKAARRLQDAYKDALGGVDAAAVDTYLEAKEKQDLNDRDSAYNRSHTETVRYREKNFDTLGAGIASGIVTEDQLVTAAQRGMIGTTQYQNLHTMLKTRKESGGDPDELNFVTIQIRRGLYTEKDILYNSNLDASQRAKALDDLKEVQINGPTYGRYEVKQGVDTIENAIGGPRDPISGRFSAVADQARVGEAIAAFHRQVKAEYQIDPNNPPTPARISEIVDTTIQGFKTKTLPALASITHLPQTPYLPRINYLRTRVQWEEAYDKAVDDLEIDHDNAFITDDAYNAQKELLKKYHMDINRIVEK